jgi:HK97 family phage portal protein
VGIRSFLRGDDILNNGKPEDRALTRGNVPPAMLPYSRSALLDVGESNVLAVTDAWACVRTLADAISALPAKVYRRTSTGRVPAGDDQRLVQLLRQPAPGATSVDLFGTAMCHLLTNGNAFFGKFRSEGSIVQLGLLDPRQVEVDLRGSRVVYTLSRREGVSEHSVEDILHVRGLSSDGVRGLSPVSRCRLALSLSANLAESAKQFFENGSRPSGILSVGDSVTGSPSPEGLDRLREEWRNTHGGVERMHRVALIEGDMKFTPIAFSNADSEFLASREFSTREVCRIFGLPPHLIGGATASDLTYTNAAQFNRYFLDYSLLPWLRRFEAAFSNDSDLCPGGVYLQFDVRGLLRPDPATRSEIYQRALSPVEGWMRRDEVRELEELPPESETNERSEST